METFDKEYLSELVTGFVDGELNSSEESMLTEALKTNPELMEEMKQLLLISDAVSNDVEAFTPPAEAVQGIFATLGYNQPYIKPLPVKRAWKPLFRKALPLALLLLSSFVVYELLTQNNDETYNNNDSSKTEKQISNVSNNTTDHEIIKTTVQSDKNSNKIPVAYSKSTDESEKPLTEKLSSKTADQRNVLLSQNELSKNNDIAQVSEYLSPESINHSNGIQSVNYNYNASSKIDASELNSPNYRFSTFTDNEVKVYIKGFNNFADNFYPASTTNAFSNVSLGMLFLNKMNFKGGFEVGQQSYSVLVSDASDENIVSESRDIFWYAATVRFDANSLTMLDMTPYAQFAIGSGNFGKYLARYSVGLEYMPYAYGIGLQLGYESSNLWYSTQNVSYSTNNSGMVVGISWRF